MGSAGIVGQTLDGKYRIESEIGKGGMGTVYLATHVGTERPVALKVIASEFMQRTEFVERFRREARAAGRLRHPNVVNVTDFGFAKIKDGEAAYLVMEYLDGCTLGEILEEEKRLPLPWTLDILEQVCSAVQEAHEQGIIHRDLKPDNIWLEPNQRGGYTVKVLDFGIAKLEEHVTSEINLENHEIPTVNKFSARSTVAELIQSNTVAEKGNSTAISESATMAQFARTDTEAGTLIQPNVPNLRTEAPNVSKELDSEAGTAIFEDASPAMPTDVENIGTKLLTDQFATTERRLASPSTAELTRVGAVLGTPLYMSPEQCRGEKLTPQSDIYSLGVIAYQMLSGQTPFSGDYLQVMEAHKNTEAPTLETKKVRKKVKRVINSAMAKDIANRPPTAQAFAAELRAESEGIRALFRRALMIYSEHLGKFLGLSLLLYSPVAIMTLVQLIFSFLYLSGSISSLTKNIATGISFLLITFFSFFCVYLIYGTTTWLVTQILAVPLRPVRLRPALATTFRRWKTFAGTGMMTAILTLIGYGICLVPGIICSVIWALVAPVVMMESLRGKAALRRSKELVKRSLRTTTATVFIMFFIPLFLSGIINLFILATVKSFSPNLDNEPVAAENLEKEADDININVKGGKLSIEENKKSSNTAKRIRETVGEALNQILVLPLSILIASFSSIVVALLYLKTRQVGGEPMRELLEQFEEADQPRTNWQRRVHARLEQSGKLTSKT